MKMLKSVVVAATVMGATFVGTSAAMADDDMLRLQSPRGFDETVTHLRDGLEGKGMTVFAEIDHAGAAAKAGLQMPPTKVLIFGNPKAGTPLMLAHPDVALDLPLRVLVRQNGDAVDVLMHRADDLDLPDEAEAKLVPAEDLIRSLVTAQ